MGLHVIIVGAKKDTFSYFLHASYMVLCIRGKFSDNCFEVDARTDFLSVATRNRGSLACRSCVCANTCFAAEST